MEKDNLRVVTENRLIVAEEVFRYLRECMEDGVVQEFVWRIDDRGVFIRIQ